MSEQEPLLPAYNPTQGNDANYESGSFYHKCQRKTAEILEHPTLHKIVILLASDCFFFNDITAT